MRSEVAILCVLVLVIAAGLGASAQNLLPHGAISIDSDHEFTPENGVCSGRGTFESPYVIEGWIIDAGYDDYGIRVHGTTKPFVIRNVEISGAARSAIYLSYVDNATIEYGTYTANWAGITLNFCQFVTVSNCAFETNTDGIHAYFCLDNQFVRNEFAGNDTALWLDASNRNIITGNLFEQSHMGVYLNLGSSENLIANNAFVDNLHNAFSDDPNLWSRNGRGNYWDRFKSVDADSDGVWDTPYRINSDGDQDEYPLVTHPLVPAPPPATCGE